MVILICWLGTGVICFVIGYSVGHSDGWKDGYGQRDDECRMRRCKKGVR